MAEGVSAECSCRLQLAKGEKLVEESQRSSADDQAAKDWAPKSHFMRGDSSADRAISKCQMRFPGSQRHG